MGSVNTQLLEGTHGNIKKDLKVGRCIKVGDDFYINSLPLINRPVEKIMALEGKAFSPTNEKDGGNLLGLLIETIKEQQRMIDDLQGQITGGGGGVTMPDVNGSSSVVTDYEAVGDVEINGELYIIGPTQIKK